MPESYKWMDGLGLGWKSPQPLILRAPLCGANKGSKVQCFHFRLMASMILLILPKSPILSCLYLGVDLKSQGYGEVLIESLGL